MPLFKAGMCATAWLRCCGLMFSHKKNLLFVFPDERIRGFHMFFVFFPIDIIFIDSNKKIVAVKEKFRPFTLYRSAVPFQYALEVGVGSVAHKGVAVGQQLVWRSVRAQQNL